MVESPTGWSFELSLKNLPQPLKKTSTSTLFSPVVENAKVFIYTLNDQIVGHLQTGHQSWNNRLRIWDLSIDPSAKRRGIGSALMNQAVTEARAIGARMIVLETQSCNVPAIQFYLKQGFKLIGFDLAHYSNQDIAQKEFRMEFGKTL